MMAGAFKRNAEKIAKREGVSVERASAMEASAGRKAVAKAHGKPKNKNLLKIGGAKAVAKKAKRR